jgi:cob(I)alamin adenosyltransferase
LLLSGQKVRKDHPVPVLCGELDELSCCLGLARASVTAVVDQWGLPRELREALLKVRGLLTSVQHDLLAAGAAISAGTWTWTEAPEALGRLDRFCDWAHAETSAPLGFVLPGSCLAEAHLHLARAVSRRAERSAQGLLEAGLLPGGELLGAYLNRLSSALFGAARVAEQQAGSLEGVPR